MTDTPATTTDPSPGRRRPDASERPAVRGGPSAPTPLAERALAPDLARGMMLLFIALAHVPWFLYEAPAGFATMHPVGGSVLDRVAQALTILLVDARTWTMFGFLFAYGIGQLTARQRERGTEEKGIRRILRRRSLWLLAFGAVHAVLIWHGDILGTYGLLGLILVPLFLRRSDKTLLIWTLVLIGVAVVVGLGSSLVALLGPPAEVSGLEVQRLAIGESSYLVAGVFRVGLWLSGLVSGVGSLVLPAAFLGGLLAARHRVLESPSRHLRLLRTVAVVGIGVGLLGGIPLVVEQLGGAPFPAAGIPASVHFLTGIGQGIGYAAAIALVARWLTGRGLAESAPVRAIVALGRRSLSGYLAQSLLFMPALAAWGLGLGAGVSNAGAVAIAVATWLVTVVASALMERAGMRGPAETLLRRLSYPRSTGKSRGRPGA